LQDNIQMDI